MGLHAVVLLAAGQGKRLQPLTRDVPKPLLDVNGQPMIAITMKQFAATGIKRFIVIVNPAMEQRFHDALDQFGFDITYVHQAVPSGMADAIALAKSLVNGPFAVCAGDMLVPGDHVADVVRAHGTSGEMATLGLIEVPLDHVPGMGNVAMDGTRVTKIIEKPSPDEVLSKIYSPPFYAFDPAMFRYLERCPVSRRGERELQDAIQMVINDGHLVTGVLIKKQFPADPRAFRSEVASLNITDATDYFNASMGAMKGTGITKPADVLCTMIEPVRIGQNCTISDDCLIGPNAIIGDNTTLDALAEVSNAIIQPGCKIGMKSLIEHAIVMQGVTVPPNAIIRGEPGRVRVVD